MKTTKVPSSKRGTIKFARNLGTGMSLLLALGIWPAGASNPPRFLDLGTLGGSRSDAVAINRAGQVVGDAQTADGKLHPFIWDPVTGMRDLGGGAWGNAAALNNLGQVVGSTTVGQTNAVLDLGTLADGGDETGGGGVILGQTVDIIRPFIWDPVNGMRELETPTGALQSFASGINDSGQVVGQVQIAGDLTLIGLVDTEWHAVLWDPANGMHMQDLGTLGGGSSGAYSINAVGQVIGLSNTDGSQGFQGVRHYFIWTASNQMLDLSVIADDETFEVGALNDLGRAAGITTGAQGEYRLVAWDSVQGLYDIGPLSAFVASVAGMNIFGDIVGSVIKSTRDTAFLFDSINGIQELPFGSASYAYDINDAGQIVGSFQSAPGLEFHAFLFNPAPPSIASLNPGTISAGSSAITIGISGSDFQSGATALWNGAERETTFLSPSLLSVQISGADLEGGTEINTAVVTVRNPNGAVSNPGSFTITPTNVTAVQSSAGDPGTVTTVSTAPSAAGQAGVTATVENTGTAPISVTAATYSSDPSGTAFSAGGGFTDLQILGADSSMSATANFYYSSSIDSTTEAALTLLYFSGSAWVPVRSDNNSDPLKDATDNPDNTVSGGRFTVTFSATSTPRITELQGTFFAAADQSIAFTGFLSPIGGADSTGGTFASPLRTFRMGSTIPVKFSASRNGAPLVVGVHTLQAVKYSNSTTSGTPIDATPQDAATSGNEFRLGDYSWIFNLDTKGTGMSVGIWRLMATLSDGSTHSAWIQLK